MGSEQRFDVTTLGETLLRLSVPAGVRLETARRLDLAPAGAEANVVAALARLRRRCAWVGGLPRNPLGRFAANHLRMAGVDLGRVVWTEGRMGLFFVELSGPPRPAQVLYDRTGSSAAGLGPREVDWDFLLDSRLLHLTGITPALSAACRELAAEAVRRARAAGVAVSFDVNYREKLWAAGEARATLEPLVREADLLFCSRPDAGRVFGLQGRPEQMADELRARTQADTVVLTLGEAGALALDGEGPRREEARPVRIVDRIGAGDALAAGVIHGWLENDLARGLRYGVTLAALALAQHGDMLVTSPGELDSLSKGSDPDVDR